MAFEDLGEYLDLLADHGELIRIRAAVDPVREMAAIARRVALSEPAPALLFENVRGCRMPAVTGLFGTGARLLKILNVTALETVADRIAAVLQPELPDSLLGALRLLPRLAEVARWPVRETDGAACQQVVHHGGDVDLTRLPFPVCWPGEELPVIAAAQLVLEEPVTETASSSSSSSGAGVSAAPASIRHVSRVPVQVLDRQQVLIHWTPQDAEWQWIHERAAAQEAVSVAIVLGGDPVLTLAADLPLPAHVDPWVFAGFLRGQPVEVTRARSSGLKVPAAAELILEAVVDPSRIVAAAPAIGTPTGWLDPSPCAIAARVVTMTHRASPILPIVIPQAPPSDDGWLSYAAGKLLLPLVRLVAPSVVSLHRPRFGAHRHAVFVSLRKRFPQEARRVATLLQHLPALETAKLIVVVDHDVNVTDEEAVWAAVAAHLAPGRDIEFSDGPADRFDHASPDRAVSRRMIFDATRKRPDEGHARPGHERLEVDAGTQALVQSRWAEYGLGRAP